MVQAVNRPPFMLGGGQVYTMGAMNPTNTPMLESPAKLPKTGGYDGSGINPGGGAISPPPVQATPAIPNTPIGATTAQPQQNYNATADNPLAALSNYQPQSKTGSYTAPSFQGQAQFEPGSYSAGSVPTPNYQAGNTQAQQVSANPASAGQFDVSAFRPFADAVYSEATRQLDPQFQSQENAFRQRMVNQGIQEGTPAFDAALANFERSRNDAYASARNQSLAQALGA